MSVVPIVSLERYGWNPELDSMFASYRAEGFSVGRVTTEHREGYNLVTEDGEVSAELAGRVRHQAAGRGDLPAVGDWVVLRRPREAEGATIHAVLPRRSKFSRKVAWAETEEQVVAANIDSVFLVSALTGDLSMRRIERYLTLAWESGANPVVVLTKSDLCADVAGVVASLESVTFGVPVHVVSNVTGQGLAELRQYLEDGRTVALLGSSGVGKSTLLNSLLGEEVQRTHEVRADGRGRHTTTQRELILLPNGGLVLDTPGMREIQLWDASEGLEGAFEDIAELAARCRFRDCEHRSEPGCEVLRAEKTGALPPGRLESYRKLQRELRALELRQDQRAAAEQRKKYRTMERAQRSRPSSKRR